MGATSLLNVGTPDWACAGTNPTKVPTAPTRARAMTRRFMRSSAEDPFVGPQMVPLITRSQQKRFQLSLALTLAGDLTAGAARFAQADGDGLLSAGHALARAPGLQRSALALAHRALHLALCLLAVLRHVSLLRGKPPARRSNTRAAEDLAIASV